MKRSTCKLILEEGQIPMFLICKFSLAVSCGVRASFILHFQVVQAKTNQWSIDWFLPEFELDSEHSVFGSWIDSFMCSFSFVDSVIYLKVKSPRTPWTVVIVSLVILILPSSWVLPIFFPHLPKPDFEYVGSLSARCVPSFWNLRSFVTGNLDSSLAGVSKTFVSVILPFFASE